MVDVGTGKTSDTLDQGITRREVLMLSTRTNSQLDTKDRIAENTVDMNGKPGGILPKEIWPIGQSSIGKTKI